MVARLDVSPRAPEVTRIVVRDQLAQLEGAFPEDAVRQVTSYRVRGAEFTPAYQKLRADGSRLWDGRRHLLLRPDNLFPAGLVEEVHRLLLRHGVPTEILDLTDYPAPARDAPEFSDLPAEGQLRGYQREGIARALVLRRGIVKIATGGGKTILAAGLVSQLGAPSLILVESKDLLLQTQSVLERHLRSEVGVIGDGRWEEKDIVIASVATLARRIAEPRTRAFLRTRKLLVVDEVHHGASDRAFQVIMACPAPYRIGLSATPTGRSDNADLKVRAGIGPVIHDVSAGELITAGVLVRPVVELIPIGFPLISQVDYATAYRRGIVECQSRNQHIVTRVAQLHREGLQTLVLVRELEHGEALLASLRATGVEAEFIFGAGNTSRERKAVLDRFRAGELRCLVSSPILDEAIDLPNIDALVLAAGGKSEIQCIQRIGRGMRAGKRSAVLLVIDFLDQTHRYLTAHSRDRLQTYNSQGYEVRYPDHWAFARSRLAS